MCQEKQLCGLDTHTHTPFELHTLLPYTPTVVSDSYVRLLSCHVTCEEIEETCKIQECVSHTHSHTHLAAGEVMSTV